MPSKTACTLLRRPRKIKDFQFDIVCSIEDITDSSIENGDEPNPLEEFMTSAKIFRDGQISKEDFIAAQESCGKIQQAIERNRPKTIIVDGIRCVRAPKQKEMNITVKYKPIIPISILVQYSMSLHFSYHTFHQSPPAILRKIKRHFYVLEDSAVRNTIGGCYLCQTSSPITDVRQTYSKHILPPKPRLHLAIDICGGVN